MRKSSSVSGRTLSSRLRDPSLAAIALILSAPPAFAQTAPAPAAGDPNAISPPQDAPATTPEEAGGKEIVVTGSRLGAGFTAPTPVTTIARTSRSASQPLRTSVSSAASSGTTPFPRSGRFRVIRATPSPT